MLLEALNTSLQLKKVVDRIFIKQTASSTKVLKATPLAVKW